MQEEIETRLVRPVTREEEGVTNPEVKPTETVCEPSAAPLDLIEVIEPREVPLGGIRAMTVRRTIPQRKRTLIGAWCFLDHYGPDDVSHTGGMNVAAHPHTGLQTVSWLFSGSIEHRDSAGTHAIVYPGEINLMTAGRGISHSERSTADTTTLHGVQLWIALPESARHIDKRFDHYAPPVMRGDGWSAQVFIGELLGDRSPISRHSPLVGAEMNLQPNTLKEIDIDHEFEHGVLVDSGSATVSFDHGDEGEGTTSLQPHDLAFSPVGARSLRITAGATGARLLLIGGAPFGERIVMWWNFIGRSHEEIVEARAEWQRVIAAEGVGSIGPRPEARREAVPTMATTDRFGLPENEPEPPLPAPPVPLARMKPRG